MPNKYTSGSFLIAFFVLLWFDIYEFFATGYVPGMCNLSRED